MTSLYDIPDLPEEWQKDDKSIWTIEWPDDFKWPALNAWLDAQLVGLHLRNLIDELYALNDQREALSRSTAPLENFPPGRIQSLDEILNPDLLSRVRREGTSALHQSKIQALFRSPDVLLDLQEDIFINGGAYWQTVPRTAEHNRLATLDFEALREKKGAAEAPTSTPALVSMREPSSQILVERKSWKNAVFAATVLAMSVLVTLAVLNPSREPQMSGTGFGTPGLLDNNVDSQLEYFQRMSVANGEWLKKSRNDSAELLAALKSYSQDCQILIDSKHPALDDRHERWLKSKCGEWKGKIDEIVAALESDKMSFEDATTKANEIVGKLVTKLNTGPTVDELNNIG